MSKYGYIGKDGPTQAVNSNAGVLNPKEHTDLVIDEKIFQFGQLELIETQTASSSSNVEFDDLGNYDIHFFTFSNLHCGDNRDLFLRVLVGGVEQSGASDYGRGMQGCAPSYFYEDRDADLHSYRILPEIGGNSPECFNGAMYMYDALNSLYYTTFSTQFACIKYDGKFLTNFGGGSYQQANVVSAVRFYMSSGNIDSGDISLYGIKAYS